MSLSDPIADMLTRIRNAARSNKKNVDIRNSKVCSGIAGVLKEEGYVNDFNVIEDGRQGILRLDLRYGPNGEQVIHSMTRESKPGRRVYKKVSDLPRPLAGLGICIVSTPKGVMSDRKARTENVGGELICIVE
ncbi:30S ribosomal protein S8 [Poriferisphaera corsica]|uniref:Small ribosomal subunit protein uS8 n=1 Tax=Poriferisphaera corsica TaxID=2528020 RepID=A0A517YT86_9BACT|nr:30S ribosomal protein S8 [Poriferisphaera corsica]QDU33362.1 30S ribosomal protein S8 [Poriferisphaera corsica]